MASEVKVMDPSRLSSPIITHDSMWTYSDDGELNEEVEEDYGIMFPPNGKTLGKFKNYLDHFDKAKETINS